MNEEELKKLEESLKEKEKDLDTREQELNEREASVQDHKEDTALIVKQVKDEYEDKMLKQRDMYDKRIKERDAVIKQLLSDGGDTNKPRENVIIDKINARRIAQNKKW